MLRLFDRKFPPFKRLKMSLLHTHTNSGWGVGQEIRSAGVKTSQVKVLRWQNGQALQTTTVDHSRGEQYVVHRADLHNALLHKAESLSNVDIKLDSTATSVDFDAASVTLVNGTKIEGDVVLGADGVKSRVRTQMLGDNADVATPTGDAVFRLMLYRDDLLKDPELAPFINEPIAHRWIGPDRHVMAYPVRGHKLFNIVMAKPDRGGLDESWVQKGSKDGVLKEFDGWDEKLMKLLRLVPDGEVLEWKLCSHSPLPTWIKGSVALMGDSCHPMLPYVAQGAAQAVEDAAALGVILSQLPSTSASAIHQALKAYETSRKERAETVQGFGKETRDALHLHDGPEQIERDLALSAPPTTETRSPDRWTDQKTRDYLWNWDAEAKAMEAWQGSEKERANL